jgi:tetratricopeptide (TPR) repeat protein
LLLAAVSALYLSGPWERGRQFAEKVIQLADVPSYRARGRYYAAWFYEHLEQFSTAETYLKQALSEFQQSHDRRGMADASFQLAVLAERAGDYELAERALYDVLELRIELGDRYQESVVYEALGDLYRDQGELDRAREAVTKAIELARAVGDEFQTAVALKSAAQLEFDAEQYETARSLVDQALPAFRESGARDEEQSALTLLSDIEVERDKLDVALAASQAALSIQVEIGDQGGKALTLQRLGYIHWYRDERERAAAAFTEAHDTFKRFHQDALAAAVVIALDELAAGKPPPPRPLPGSS